MNDDTLSFGLQGLTCAGCVGRAEAALTALPGARDVRVNLADHSARISGVMPDAVVSALADAGYPADPAVARFEVPNMSCASCVARIETAARTVPGVTVARAQLPTRSMTVETLGAVDAISDALTAAGYPPKPVIADSQDAPDPARGLLHRFALAAILTLPVFVLEMGSHAIPGMHHWIARTIGMQTSHVIQLILTA
ncbi:MAG: cation transporter, partial [Pseudomonadota bacterium]